MQPPHRDLLDERLLHQPPETKGAIGHPRTASARQDVQVPTRAEPGLAFCFVTDAGWAVGVVTHDRPKLGSLVWIAEPMFDEVPTVDQIQTIGRWRWPVFFSVTAALRKGLIDRVGTVEVPSDIAAFPVLRSGDRQIGWVAFTEVDGVRQRLGPTEDRSLPINQVVNDTRLKEMVVSGWRPDDEW